MAQRNFLDLTGLKQYDVKKTAQIDEKVAAGVQLAKNYADSKDDQFEAAGSVNTAKEELNAKIKENTDAISAINDAETGILKQSKDYADGKDTAINAAQSTADAAQATANAVKDSVGNVPEGQTVMGIIENIQENAYDDTELRGLISGNTDAIDAVEQDVADEETRAKGVEEGLRTDVDAIKDDYLKTADKTELSNAITSEASTARAAEKANADAIKAIQEDYLKTADKTELQGNIDTVNTKVDILVGEDSGKSARTIANEELAKQLIAEGAKESLNTLAEIASWIQSHPDDASAMNKAIDDLEALIGTLPEGVTATTIVAYIQEVVSAEKTRAEGVENGLASRITTLEETVGEGGSVDEKIESAVSVETKARESAIAEVQADADKGIADAADALTAAQNADTKAQTAQNEVDALELVVATKASNDDLNILAGRATTVEGKVATAEGEIDTLQSEMDAVEAKAAANETAIGTLNTTVAGKAAQSDLDGVANRTTAVETSLTEGGATANAIAAAKASGDNAQKEVDALEIVVATAESNITKNATAITNLQSTDTAHADRLTALEEVVGDGCGSIALTDIDALFKTTA